MRTGGSCGCSALVGPQADNRVPPSTWSTNISTVRYEDTRKPTEDTHASQREELGEQVVVRSGERPRH
eukprot:2128710-Prymnesium_polylepis.1